MNDRFFEIDRSNSICMIIIIPLNNLLNEKKKDKEKRKKVTGVSSL
jgi:hypothetical protein